MTPRPATRAWVEWECGFGFDQVSGEASDTGARDREGEESEGGALGREGGAEAEDWVFAGMVGSNLLSLLPRPTNLRSRSVCGKIHS
jgi:hypothetical protein